MKKKTSPPKYFHITMHAWCYIPKTPLTQAVRMMKKKKKQKQRALRKMLCFLNECSMC